MPRIPPSLPVKKSVLRQLGINELPHGLAHLKHNLLLSPSHTPSQDSNICTNIGLSRTFDGELLERVYDTIAESGPDPDIDNESKKKTFKSMYYLDQIAIVCLAAGLRACQAPDCLHYRRKLERVVPVCQSWPGLRDWVLCITSCSLRAHGETLFVLGEKSKQDLLALKEYESRNGLVNRNDTLCGLIDRRIVHLHALILLTAPPGVGVAWDWTLGDILEPETLEDESGSIGGPRPDQTVYSDVKLFGKAHPAYYNNPSPVPRPNIYMQTFDPLQEESVADLSVDVAEVFQLVVWLRNLEERPTKIPTSSWHDRGFIPVASKAVEEASEKISMLGFCQQRVWAVVRDGHDGELELVPLVITLEQFSSQLRHDRLQRRNGEDYRECHESCTVTFCEHAAVNFTSVPQLHKCLNPNYCVPTTDKMFNQSLLVDALNENDKSTTTAWTLDGMSLVAQGKSYLAVSHVWSDGTGVGAWKAGRVNKCIWSFFVDTARRLGCDGVWWDTVCIPQDRAARSTALNNMHRNYGDAQYTLVHDLYLAGIEWKDDGSPCIALVLSPWFTRGWTALELLLSKRVFVLFKQGDGYILKDLDQEVLAHHRFLQSHAHWIATFAVKRLRPAEEIDFFKTLKTLRILKSRYTSWSRDQSIIAGLMCGLKDFDKLSEQEITKRILTKGRMIERKYLLHNLPTMSDPLFSWCPPRFLDLYTGLGSEGLLIDENGTMSGRWEIWYIPSKTCFDRGIIWPSSMDVRVRIKVQWALHEAEKCVILTCDEYGTQGLLVRLKAYNDRPQEDTLYCKYIGLVNVHPGEIRKSRFCIRREVVIGYLPGMVDVGVMDWERNDREYKQDMLSAAAEQQGRTTFLTLAKQPPVRKHVRISLVRNVSAE